MKDLQRITINIADQPGIAMDIPRDREEWIRTIERNVNKLWANWCEMFPGKSHQEVLAMVTFQYAKHYYDLVDTLDTNEKEIKAFENALDSILLETK